MLRWPCRHISTSCFSRLPRSSSRSSSRRSSSSNNNNNNVLEERTERDESVLYEQVRALLLGEAQPVVKVGDSRIPASGKGIFATTDISQGKLVSLYPGYFYPYPPVWTVAASNGEPTVGFAETDALPTSDYLLSCSEHNGSLDGYNCPSNSKAVAQLANHPPPHLRPNVIVRSFKWCDVLGCSLETCSDAIRSEVGRINRIGEGLWYIDPMDGQAIMLYEGCVPLVGAMFMACADISANDEVLFDYGLSPKQKHPNWYQAVKR